MTHAQTSLSLFVALFSFYFSCLYANDETRFSFKWYWSSQLAVIPGSFTTQVLCWNKSSKCPRFELSNKTLILNLWSQPHTHTLSWIVCGRRDTTSGHGCYAADCGWCDGTCRTSSSSPQSKQRWQNTTGGVTLRVRQVLSKVGKTQADRSVPQTLKHTHTHNHTNTEREVETMKYA